MKSVVCPAAMLFGAPIKVNNPKIIKRTVLGSLIEYSEILSTVDYALFSRGKLVYFTLKNENQSYTENQILEIL